MTIELHRERNAWIVLAFLIILCLAAPSAFFLQPLPPSLARTPKLGHLAAWFLVGGAVAGLVSQAIARWHDASILWEQGAVYLCGLSALIYIVALLQGPSFSAAAWALTFTGLIALICVWRFIQIQRYVRKRRRNKP